MTTFSTSLLEAPASDDILVRDTLAHIEAHDAASNEEYAFVAYKETHRQSGSWCVRIDSRQGHTCVFHPNAIRLQARAIAAQGKRWFVWGNPLSPTAHDLRKIEFRVHVSMGQPTAIEIFLRLRRFDHAPDEPRTILFPWPA